MTNRVFGKITIRRGLEAAWIAEDPVLLDGEIGYAAAPINLIKIGDGVSTWTELDYVYASSEDESIWISAASLLPGGGYVDFNDIPGASFGPSATIPISVNVPIPPTWGEVRIRIHHIVAESGTGTIIWTSSYAVTELNDTVPGALTFVSDQQFEVTAENNGKILEFGVGANIDVTGTEARRILTIAVGRDGLDGFDDFAGNAFIYGISVERTA